MSEALFVYGLLRYGFTMHRDYLSLARLLGVGYVEGFDVYDLGGYPGARMGRGRVWGEVYLVDEDQLRRLDSVETGYRRVKVNVILVPMPDMGGGPSVDAWMYLWEGPVDHTKAIVSGDYSLHMNREPIVPYFSYGANVNPEVISERVGRGCVAAAEPAVLKGYRRVFNKPCASGFCANIVEDDDSVVKGVLYYIRRGCMEKLDRAEGHPKEYKRIVMAVHRVTTGLKVYAAVYKAEARGSEGPPSCDYICGIVAGLRFHGLIDEAYSLSNRFNACSCEDRLI